MPSRRTTLAAIALLAAIGLARSIAARDAEAGGPVDPLGAPSLLLLATPPRGDTTTLLVAKPGAAPVELASFSHRPDAVVRGAVLPGRDVVVAIADAAPDRERSWASALLRLEPGAPARLLVDSVAHASRPVVTPSGRVLVARGAQGDERVGETGKIALRVDPIAVDEVDPDSGAVKTLYSENGHLAQPVAVFGNEAIVYRVDDRGADVVAIDLATTSLRVVAPTFPGGRDFSIDPTRGALVAQRFAGSPAHPVVVRVDLASGAETVLAEQPTGDLVPFALPTGDVLFANRDRGASVIGKSPAPTLDDPGAFFWARAVSGEWLAALAMREHELPRPLLVRISDGATFQVPRVDGARIEIAGFAGGTP